MAIATWDERPLRPSEAGKWIERRNLALATIAGDAAYPIQLTVAINWDGGADGADAGLAEAEAALVTALTRDDLCLHALSFMSDNEWDLVFYTNSARKALEVVEVVESSLEEVTLIPEVVQDRDWSYYRSRMAAQVDASARTTRSS
jgi:hypothetical protein